MGVTYEHKNKIKKKPCSGLQLHVPIFAIMKYKYITGRVYIYVQRENSLCLRIQFCMSWIKKENN